MEKVRAKRFKQGRVLGLPVLQAKGRWKEASARLWAWKHGIRPGMLGSLHLCDYHFLKSKTVPFFSAALILRALGGSAGTATLQSYVNPNIRIHRYSRQLAPTLSGHGW